MSNEKPQPQSEPPNAWVRREVIPIKTLQFDSTRAIPVPGKMLSSSVSSNPERPKNREYHYIVYVPALRHYVVSFHSSKPSDPVQTRMIHECHVLAAEPLL